MRITTTVLAWPLAFSNVLALPSLWSAQEQLPLPPHISGGGSNSSKVDVTLYVMSRCPDARLCENVFEDVLQHEGVQDKINFKLEFIAHRNKSESGGFSCKHGSAECAGNIHDLCLQKHLSLPDFYASLTCQNFESPFPGKIGDIALTRRCAEASKVDWWGSGVGGCIFGRKAEKDGGKKALKKGKLGKEGRKLLKKSIKATERNNVTKSCTIDIGEPGKRRCIVDDGKWSGCDDGHTASDFVRVIQQEWKDLQGK